MKLHILQTSGFISGLTKASDPRACSPQLHDVPCQLSIGSTTSIRVRWYSHAATGRRLNLSKLAHIHSGHHRCLHDVKRVSKRYLFELRQWSKSTMTVTVKARVLRTYATVDGKRERKRQAYTMHAAKAYPRPASWSPLHRFGGQG